MQRFAPFALAAAVVALAATWPIHEAHAQVRLPALGDAVSEDFDILAERRLGDRIMREVRRDPAYLDDPALLEYLRSLFDPLLAAARSRGEIGVDLDNAFAWEPFLVGERPVNAFALPGGYVGVYLGLIALTGNSDELASVLAHEMSHVTQRHIARSAISQQRQGLAAMAGMILGVLAASRANSTDAAQAVIMGTQAAAAQGQLNFSREMEREADRIGIEVLASAGFAPGGMVGMFEKLDNAMRLNDSNQYPYLRSHPLTIERISDARLRVREAAALPPPPETGRASAASSPGVKGPPVRSLVPHALMQARAKVLMDKTDQGLLRQQALGAAAAPGTGPAADLPRLATLYAGAMASMQLRDFDRALQTLAAGEALARGPFAQEPEALRQFTLLRVDILSDRGGPPAQLGPALTAALAPLAADRSRPAMLARADAALARQRSGEPAATETLRQATESLQTWVSEHKRDALAWQTLARCAEPLGLRLRSLRAGAEAAYANGDVLGAVDRLRVARQIAQDTRSDDYIETSVIQARLRELEGERRRLLAEMRGERHPEDVQ
ncbi:M48 family metalloprotease [Ideonella sp.]|uniref:M48 family metalloprotease n=1 Tax=Ideonella sp. TaxID=1929293 RepID=UPI002B476AD3|nr:M48 family metalloprotease [Ideonella sp.]HJV69469.1 M48 family metalloprotease [Ideonella sp.]